MGWNQLKMNWEWTFVYLPFIWTTLLKVSLCLKERQGNFFIFSASK